MLIEEMDKGERLHLNSPTELPNASAFLWNKNMMIHMNCRGYAVAQFMQPEPAKYAHPPVLEAKTFMQPEQPYYKHHPGRFCYVKDENTQGLFSLPYEPVRRKVEKFSFSAGKSSIGWQISQDGLMLEMSLGLPEKETVELWRIKIRNTLSTSKQLSIYPFFPVGYMSWMNQSGVYDPDLRAIVCTCITPYQKYQDYYHIREFKDKTFLISDHEPVSWEVNQAVFEGEGGLHNPSAIQQDLLQKGEAIYEIPACIFQFRLDLEAGQEQEFRFLFGPAKDNEEIENIRQRYFTDKDKNGMDGFERAETAYAGYINQGRGCIRIKTPDPNLDNFVNHWLPRQIFYHGETNRLCTDPQTRNYLQDNMGMSYIKPQMAREAFLLALSQQKSNGAMPDGILIREDAELKYINQVPHTDHCVWLPICLKAFLDETADYEFLDEKVPFADGIESATVYEHINRAMFWLLQSRDERGLNFINQGDWCDPMNMVGHKGKGVSGWLSMATAYALQVWADICKQIEAKTHAETFHKFSQEINDAINTHLWDGEWYARGITDDNRVFGISADEEGRIFLNAQSWALLCGCADETKIKAMLQAVETQLETPYGVEMLGPPFTAMREDVGRVTQKHPGSAENGSVYNHAAAFYIYGLYLIGEKDRAFRLLKKMMPGPDEADLIQRGQMPVFIPNYYRGAFRQFPRTAGRSSQLFNTGTVHWIYRSLIDGLFGLQGSPEGLNIDPQLPGHWHEVFITRRFMKAEFIIRMARMEGIIKTEIEVDGKALDEPRIRNILPDKVYKVLVKIPFG